MSDEDHTDLAEGVSLFNAGKYWDAHEAWEKVWQRHPAQPWRFFVQGLIQAAAAHHQLQRGIRHGVVKHLHNALAKLDAAPSDFAGLNLGPFRDYLRQLLDAIEIASLERVPPPLQLRLIQRGDSG